MRRLQRFRDDRFALTSLQNPTIEVRTYAEPCQAAQLARENQPAPAAIPAPISATPLPPAPAAPYPLPARTNALPAVKAGLPAAQAGLSAAVDMEILIASSPNIRNRCKPLKTILTCSS